MWKVKVTKNKGLGPVPHPERTREYRNGFAFTGNHESESGWYWSRFNLAKYCADNNLEYSDLIFDNTPIGWRDVKLIVLVTDKYNEDNFKESIFTHLLKFVNFRSGVVPAVYNPDLDIEWRLVCE